MSSFKDWAIKFNADSKTLVFCTPYDESFLQCMRSIKMVRWNKDKKRWECTVTSVSELDALREAFRFFDSTEVKKVYEQVLALEKREKAIVPDGKTLYKFQEEGVRWLCGRSNGLLADEMGLGKTIQVIATLNTLESKGENVYPVLIVCPAILKHNWHSELRNWLIGFKSIQIVNGRSDFIDVGNDIVIVNYDVLEYYIDKIAVRVMPKTLILDESHYIKNRNAKRTKAVYELVKRCCPRRIYALSGTPMLNRPVELWTVLHLLAPHIFKSFWAFAKKFCAPYHNGFGWVFGASNIVQLGDLLRKTIMLRREKRDVLHDLPDKIRTIAFAEGHVRRELEEKAQALYFQMAELFKDDNTLFSMLKDSRSLSNVEVFNKVTELKKRFGKLLLDNMGLIEEYRQEAAEKKLPFVFEFIDNCIEQDEQIVIFVHHRNIWGKIMERFKDVAVGIHGGDSALERQKAVESFQSGKAKVFVGSIRASGQGITLSSASKVLFVEYDWTPSVMIQAEDRLHRIGQKSVVHSYWVVLKDTIDESFVRLILDKVLLLNQFFEEDVFGESLVINV